MARPIVLPQDAGRACESAAAHALDAREAAGAALGCQGAAPLKFPPASGQPRVAAALIAAAKLRGSAFERPWLTADIRSKLLAGVVDPRTLRLFQAAHQVEPMTPMSWLLGALTVLLDRVEQGLPLQLHMPEGERWILNERAYRAWVRAEFPGRTLP